MDLKLLAAILTLALVVAASLINTYKIVTKKVSPTLSTWVIILAASLMSFASYLVNSHRDLVAGALNAADVLSTAIISFTILFFSAGKWQIKPFEKYYFFGLLLIGLFWLLTSDAFHSNLLVQILITIGYLPTAHTIIKYRRNSESFLVWGLILLASVVSLYPAVLAWHQDNNLLSLVYTLRSIVMLGFMLILMSVYRRSNYNNPA